MGDDPWWLEQLHLGHGDDLELPGFEEDDKSSIGGGVSPQLQDKGGLFAVNKIIPPSLIGITIRHYKDPYINQPSSIIDFYTDFEHSSCIILFYSG